MHQKQEIHDIFWPNITVEETFDGANWKISEVLSNRESAADIAKISSEEAPFLRGRCALNWLLSAPLVEEQFNDRNFSFWGVWRNTEFVGVFILKAHQIDLVIELAFCAVDSKYKCINCSEMIARFTVDVLNSTKAQVLYADCVTHILGAQSAVESAGFRPIGVQLGMEVFAGKNGCLSRATTIRYAVYSENVKCRVLSLDELRLTKRSAVLVEAVKSGFENCEDNTSNYHLKKVS